MLILSRKEDQSVAFPSHGIVVHVVSIRGKTIKLGVVAPKDVEVVRSELAHDSGSVLSSTQRESSHTNRLQHVVDRLKTVTEAVRLIHDLKSMGQYKVSEQKFNQLLDTLSEYDTEPLRDESFLAESSEVAVR